MDAQKDKLRKYAEFQDMEIAREYSDEGHSGKNVVGRPEFMRMLNDIEDDRDGVSFVLVFKLSRFGRNASDVLSTYGNIGKLQRINRAITKERLTRFGLVSMLDYYTEKCVTC